MTGLHLWVQKRRLWLKEGNGLPWGQRTGWTLVLCQEGCVIWVLNGSDWADDLNMVDKPFDCTDKNHLKALAE